MGVDEFHQRRRVDRVEVDRAMRLPRQHGDLNIFHFAFESMRSRVRAIEAANESENRKVDLLQVDRAVALSR